MAEQYSSEESRDTSPLALEQLSKHELATILRIERRLYEAQQSTLELDHPKSQTPYLARVQVRHPRVLLLDGDRGTGKTSMLLTLVERWSRKPHGVTQSDTDYSEKIAKKIRQFSSGAHDSEIPSHVSVVGRIIDFDPLPRGMPVIAGIIEAWRPLVQEYDKLSGYPEECDEGEEGETLIDRWHRLFHVAAVGWSAVPTGTGLIEQVLDREEQVRDWQNLDKRWQAFIDEVIAKGRCLKPPHRLNEKPVFVVMIDDSDLQVEKVGELLPALRMLYHPSVFFLVAAHRPHMIDMLELDFLGQQNRLANCHLQENALLAGDSDRWASNLAKSSFEKVFPIRNRWVLSQLSLRDLLDFPRGEHHPFGGILKFRDQQQALPNAPELGTLDAYLRAIAGTDAEPTILPLKWTYRTAHQIYERVRGDTPRPGKDAEDRSTPEGPSTNEDDAAVLWEIAADRQNRAAEAIGRIIGGADYEDIVRITGWLNSDAADATSLGGHPSGHRPIIEYLIAGKLTSFAPEEIIDTISEDASIILSSQPGFRYSQYPWSDLPEITPAANVVRRTTAILAKSLEDDGYGVVAPLLRWDVGLALAWTRVSLPIADLAFRWRLYQHPSPLRLLHLAKEWRKFIVRLSQQTEGRLDHIAYGWIYHQLRWMSKTGLTRDLEGVPTPFSVQVPDEESWEALLRQSPEIGTPEEASNWHSLTLPLLARPEIGLSLRVQERLLAPVKGDQEAISRLWHERRRLITDAIVAAAEEKGEHVHDPESEAKVAQLVTAFELRHRRTYRESPSRWWEIVEKPREEEADAEDMPF
jgi:hypothetical protein